MSANKLDKGQEKTNALNETTQREIASTSIAAAPLPALTNVEDDTINAVAATSAATAATEISKESVVNENVSAGVDYEDGAAEEAEEGTVLDMISAFAKKLILGSSTTTVERVIPDLTFDGLTNYWKENGFKRIITMVGAGISTSAGIPDFRSAGTGLYDNLQKYKLPYPEAIFDIDYFKKKPGAFFTLAKELYPGNFNPTPSHYFVRLLAEKGLLVRHYTQNIDTLERVAGIDPEKLVEAHGTFASNHCMKCKASYSMQWMKDEIFADRIPKCTKCKGTIKPDIVFFRENLPDKFYTLPTEDFKDCDLLIIMGTSLEVQPFASLIDYVTDNCVRLLINREKVGQSNRWFPKSTDLKYDDEANNTRDIAYVGDCDDGVWALVERLGWTEDLRALIKSETARLASETGAAQIVKIEAESKNTA